MSELVKTTKWKGLQDLLEIAQPGDMIEFHRGYYCHWAIFVGDEEVIHRWGENDGVGHSVGLKGNLTSISGVQFNKASIEKSKLSIVLPFDGKARVNNSLDKKYRPLPIQIILKKAESALGQQGYNVIYSNCEHFATDCRYGQSNSTQVQTVVGSLATGVFVTFLAGTAAYFLRSSSQNKEEEEKKKLKYK